MKYSGRKILKLDQKLNNAVSTTIIKISSYKRLIYTIHNNVPFILKFDRIGYFIIFYCDIENFELDVNSIGLSANRTDWLYFNGEEIITLNIHNHKMFILIFDPQLRNRKNFQYYLKKYFFRRF